MTDLDALKRTIADLEKRVTQLENRQRQPVTYYGSAPKTDEQWCRCGRDVCRYPACSSKVASVVDDPLGR